MMTVPTPTPAISSSHDLVTPPGSLRGCSLTPPPTDEKQLSTVLRIIEDIRRRKTKTNVPIPWAVYSLDTQGYRALLRRIQQDQTLAGFVEHKLRFDYFPSVHRLVLRMPTAVHEIFLGSVVEEIKTQLKSFSGPSADFARSIKSIGSTRLKFEDTEFGSHDPDGQFQYPTAQYPGVVIEVSYSQKKIDIPRLADDYILGSDANIRFVLGLDIEYNRAKKKMATWSIWEPAIVKDENEDEENELRAKQTFVDQVFCTPAGSPPSPSIPALEIPLQAFATPSCYPSGIPPQGNIVIPALTLYTFLQEAENMASVVEQKTGLVNSPAAKNWGKKKRAREITPEDELHENDEKRFKADEERVLKLEMMNDGSFEGSIESEGSGV